VPRVEVDPPPSAELPVTDLRGLAPDARRDALRQRLDAAARHRFDLAAGPLWRAELLRLAPDDHVLALTFHHAVFDGWSQRPYFADLGRAYAAARAGAPAELPAPPARFADNVAWRAERDRRRGEADLAWWVRHLAGAPAVLDLPRDAPRPPVQTYRGAELHARVPLATAVAVRELAARVGATAPAVLLAGFAELLHRLTGGRDLIVGTPAADRRHEAFHRLVGFFIEVVPLRLRLEPSQSFAERARACAGELLDVLAHPSVPLDRIVTALGVPRDPSRPPLVQVLFNVYNFPEPRLRLEGVAAERLAPGLAGSPFDFTVYVAERDGAFAVDLVHNPDLHRPPRMRALLDAYLRLLDQACAAPEEPLERIALPDLPAAGRPAQTPGRLAEAAPAPKGPAQPAPVGRVGPATDSERLVARVWREVLSLEAVGATDNFFDAGGDSMAAVVVQARLAELLGREIGIVDLFRYPSVRSLAAHLDGGSGAAELRRAADRGAARRDRARSRAAGRAGGTGESHQEVGRQ
jgi:acyl carrier protein